VKITFQPKLKNKKMRANAAWCAEFLKILITVMKKTGAKTGK
jgi:hypothetical protein